PLTHLTHKTLKHGRDVRRCHAPEIAKVRAQNDIRPPVIWKVSSITRLVVLGMETSVPPALQVAVGVAFIDAIEPPRERICYEICALYELSGDLRDVNQTILQSLVIAKYEYPISRSRSRSNRWFADRH